ncbi:MAG: hypothetical protein ACKO40_14140 [Planctomycetaceae bacterium]
MDRFALITSGTRAICLASLVASGCGGGQSGPPKPAVVSEDQARQSEQAARAAAEAEGAAMPAEPPAK